MCVRACVYIICAAALTPCQVDLDLDLSIYLSIHLSMYNIYVCVRAFFFSMSVSYAAAPLLSRLAR